MRALAFLTVFVALPALAAEPATSMSSAGMGAQLSKLMLGLLLVIGLIFLLAWLLRRVQQLNPRGTQVIKLISTQALGPRERLVLVQVGGEHIDPGIAVDAPDGAAGGVQDGPRVTAGPEGAVHVDAAVPGGQDVQHLRQHHRRVGGGHEDVSPSFGSRRRRRVAPRERARSKACFRLIS